VNKKKVSCDAGLLTHQVDCSLFNVLAEMQFHTSNHPSVCPSIHPSIMLWTSLTFFSISGWLFFFFFFFFY